MVLLHVANVAGSTVIIKTDRNDYAIDQTIEIQTSGLQDGHEYTVYAETKDESEKLWTAHASFFAKQGKIDFSQKPELGTYTKASTQGLFWSMRPADYQVDHDFFRPKNIFKTDLKLFDQSGKQLAQTSFTRSLQVDRLKIETSRTRNSFYDLVIPDHPGKKPAILLLGGSEGGLSSHQAKIIASHGFVVMTLAYFGIDPLPLELNLIPLEYIQHNAKILKSHPQVDASRIYIWGSSKGGELALLSASTFPDSFKAVVALVPSNFIWQGITKDFKALSSWSFEGQALPFLTFIYEEADFKTQSYRLRVGYERGLQLSQNKQISEILVENISGPILFVSGTDDQVWPSSTMANLAVQRLAEKGFKYKVKHLEYEGAGHFIGLLPSWPTSGRVLGSMYAGGNQEADGLACESSWPQIIQFLSETSKAQ